MNSYPLYPPNFPKQFAQYAVGAFPSWVSSKALLAYLAALAVVSLLYINRLLPWYFMLSGIVAVLVFFFGSSQLARKWDVQHIHSEKRFESKLFWLSFILRLGWTLLIYNIFMTNWGDPFGFDNADAIEYDAEGKRFAMAISGGYFLEYWNQLQQWKDISDMGMTAYIGFIYTLTNDSILFIRILKCIWSSLTVLFIYRLAKRNFGENIARWAGILCMLWPNFWYYCGTHLKEAEMLFLATLFVDQADQMLKSRNFTTWKVIPILLIIAALFTIRTPLAVVSILSLLFAILLSSSRVVSWAKRISIGVLVLALVAVTMGNRIQEQAQAMYDKVSSGSQQASMEWRSNRVGAGTKQSFAKYAGVAVFAPMIFTVPFPTMTTIKDDFQYFQRMANGANFDKNIMSFFVILAMLYLLVSGKWRDHTLPISFLLGYLVVLAFSPFAQSERFHQPAMPFEFMFAAYGLSLVAQGVPIASGIGGYKAYRRWFTIWLVVMFVAAIMWNWFKLAGRGLA